MSGSAGSGSRRTRGAGGPAGDSRRAVSAAARLALVALLAGAVVVVGIRLLTFGPRGPVLGPTLGGTTAAVVGLAELAIPAFLLVTRPSRRPSRLVVGGFLIVAIAQVAGVLVTAVVNLAVGGRGLGGGATAIGLFVSPAIANTSAVGIALAALGLGTRDGGAPRVEGAAAVFIGACLWVGLGIASVAQDLIILASSLAVLVGQIANAVVVIGGMLAIGVAAARRGSSAGFRVAAIGAVLVAAGSAIGTVLFQLVALSPAEQRGWALTVALGLSSAASVAGWLLLAVAAWRGLPAAVPVVEPQRPALAIGRRR